MAAKRFSSRRFRLAGFALPSSSRRVNSPAGSSPMSSPNMQNISFIRKWAARSGSMPLSRMPSARSPNRSAASTVMASLVMPGRSGLGIGEQLAEDVEVGRLGQPGQVELVFPLGRGGEVGMDLEAVHVANDQQRRVLQVFAVEQQLGVGRLQVLVLALVLPAEVAAHPDVGPAVAALGLLDALLEGVPLALRVGLGRLGLVRAVRTGRGSAAGRRSAPRG